MNFLIVSWKLLLGNVIGWPMGNKAALADVLKMYKIIILIRSAFFWAGH